MCGCKSSVGTADLTGKFCHLCVFVDRRVHALFYTDKVCCEPLTPWLHFADLRDAQPSYMLGLVRVVDALAVLCNDLCKELRPLVEAGPSHSASPPARSQQLMDGIPWMLRDDRCETHTG